jgi:hypothetical protein
MASTAYLQRLAKLGLTAERKPALASAWRAFWTSRLLVWSAAIAGVLVFGTSTFRQANPAAEDPADSLSGYLLSPARRWDSGWYLSIADRGYDIPDSSATAFYPLYPLFMRIVGAPVGSFEVGGIVVSLGAFIVALYLLHRLAELETGRDAADRTVLLLAFFPMAFYFSAIYTESLFLALTVGCIYSARRGWWARAAALGALAAATRSPGLLLVIPLLIMLLYGPREDGTPFVAQAGRSGRPRYRPRSSDAAFLITIPLGLLAYLAYVRLTTKYGALAPFKSQGEWSREFKGPILGVWGGVKNATVAARDFLAGSSAPDDVIRNHLLNFSALAFASVGVVGAFRRLPAAYGAYALAGLAFSISFPDSQLMLPSLPRYIIVLFPIFMWLGLVTERWSQRTVVLAAFAAGLALYTALFASGYWIA